MATSVIVPALLEPLVCGFTVHKLLLPMPLYHTVRKYLKKCAARCAGLLHADGSEPMFALDSTQCPPGAESRMYYAAAGRYVLCRHNKPKKRLANALIAF